MSLQIKAITIHELALTLKQPFKTAHDVTLKRPITLVNIEFTNGIHGIGEVATFADNAYTAETQAISVATLKLLAPQLLGLQVTTPQDFAVFLAPKTQWSFAKAGLEMAVWDAIGQVKKQSLAQLLGVVKSAVRVGIALGIPADEKQLQATVAQAVADGYQRIKLKLSANTPLIWITKITRQYPNILFSVDANASWTVNDQVKIAALAQAGIYLLEQPFAVDEWEQHYRVQQENPTIKISLDESLNSLADVKRAVEVTPVGALTLKQGKIGGITNTMMALEMTHNHAILPWIGGMLSSGLGRAVDLALAGLPGADDFPSDSSASNRYFEQDIIHEQPQVIAGQLPIPTQAGLGVTLNWEIIEQLQVAKTHFE